MEENNIYLLNSTSISKIKQKVVDSMKKRYSVELNVFDSCKLSDFLKENLVDYEMSQVNENIMHFSINATKYEVNAINIFLKLL